MGGEKKKGDDKAECIRFSQRVFPELPPHRPSISPYTCETGHTTADKQTPSSTLRYPTELGLTWRDVLRFPGAANPTDAQVQLVTEDGHPVLPL